MYPLDPRIPGGGLGTFGGVHCGDSHPTGPFAFSFHWPLCYQSISLIEYKKYCISLNNYDNYSIHASGKAQHKIAMLDYFKIRLSNSTPKLKSVIS